MRVEEAELHRLRHGFMYYSTKSVLDGFHSRHGQNCSVSQRDFLSFFLFKKVHFYTTKFREKLQKSLRADKSAALHE